jgi:hypothetical protein
MSAAITDLLTKVGSPGTVTSLSSPGKAIGASSINVGSTVNYPTDTAVYFAMRQINPLLVSSTNPSGFVANTYTEWKGIVAGGSIINTLTLQDGTDQVYPAGTNTQVFISVMAPRENAIVTWGLAQHNQDGSHAAITTTGYNQTSGTFAVPNGTISSRAVDDVAAFFAYLSADYSAGTLIQVTNLDTKWYDNGSNFNTTTHTFTAPFNGVYHFDGCVEMFNSAAFVFYSMFIATISSVTSDFYGAYTNGPAGGAFSNVARDLKLSAGDTVKLGYFGASGDTVKGGQNVTSFNGHLVSAI